MAQRACLIYPLLPEVTERDVRLGGGVGCYSLSPVRYNFPTRNVLTDTRFWIEL